MRRLPSCAKGRRESSSFPRAIQISLSHSGNSREQLRKVVLSDLPDHLIFDDVVPVYQDIPEGDDLRAVSQLVCGFRVQGCQPAGSFANDLEISLDGLAQQPV